MKPLSELKEQAAKEDNRKEITDLVGDKNTLSMRDFALILFGKEDDELDTDKKIITLKEKMREFQEEQRRKVNEMNGKLKYSGNEFFEGILIETSRGNYSARFLTNLSYDSPEILLIPQGGGEVYGLDFRPIVSETSEVSLVCAEGIKDVNSHELSKTPFVLVKKDSGGWLEVGKRDVYALSYDKAFDSFIKQLRIKEFLKSKC